MGFPTETYLERIRHTSGVGSAVAQELDALYAQVQGYLAKEHNPDGTHRDVITCGVPVDVIYNASNFSGGAGTWTVDAADQAVFRYTRNGRWVRFNLTLRTTTVAGTTNTLSVTLPFPAGAKVDIAGKALDNLTDKTTFASVAVGSTTLALTLASGANWAASTNATYIFLDFDLFLV